MYQKDIQPLKLNAPTDLHSLCHSSRKKLLHGIT